MAWHRDGHVHIMRYLVLGPTAAATAKRRVGVMQLPVVAKHGPCLHNVGPVVLGPWACSNEENKK